MSMDNRHGPDASAALGGAGEGQPDDASALVQGRPSVARSAASLGAAVGDAPVEARDRAERHDD